MNIETTAKITRDIGWGFFTFNVILFVNGKNLPNMGLVVFAYVSIGLGILALLLYLIMNVLRKSEMKNQIIYAITPFAMFGAISAGVIITCILIPKMLHRL